MSKLTESEAIAVLKLWSLGYRDFGALFNISNSTVMAIARGDRWNHLTRTHEPYRHPRKITGSQIVEMLALYKTGTRQIALATRYGLAKSTINGLIKANAWWDHGAVSHPERV